MLRAAMVLRLRFRNVYERQRGLQAGNWGERATLPRAHLLQAARLR